MPDDVYEVVDATDDEVYYTIGIYSTVELALAALDQDEPVETYNGLDYFGLYYFEVRRRPLDKDSEHGTVAARVTWTRLPIEDDDEKQRWKREVTND